MVHGRNQALIVLTGWLKFIKGTRVYRENKVYKASEEKTD
jgi:hypothetical protein